MIRTSIYKRSLSFNLKFFVVGLCVHPLCIYFKILFLVTVYYRQIYDYQQIIENFNLFSNNLESGNSEFIRDCTVFPIQKIWNDDVFKIISVIVKDSLFLSLKILTSSTEIHSVPPLWTFSNFYVLFKLLKLHIY